MPRLSECGKTAGIAVHNDAGDYQGNESGRCQIDEQVPIVVRVAATSLSRMWSISVRRDLFYGHEQENDAKRFLAIRSLFLRQLRHAPHNGVATASGAKRETD